MESWLAAHRVASAGTAELYETAWRRFYAHSGKMPWEVTPRDVTDWMQAMLDAGRDKASINTYVAAISSLYEYCLHVAYPPVALYNPCRAAPRYRVKMYGKADRVTAGEVKRILAAIPQVELEDLRDRAMLLALWTMGLRNSAVRCMLRGDVVERGTGVILTVRSKGETDSRPYPARAYAALAAYIEAREKALGRALAADNYIFVQHTSNSEHWPRNRPLSMQCCGDMVARRSLAAIGRRVRPHWFRHGAAKELHDRTRDVVKVKDFLGHESLATTYIYLHTLEDRRGEDGDLLAGVV
jgi:integrase/recombinase XerD